MHQKQVRRREHSLDYNFKVSQTVLHALEQLQS